MLLNNPMPFFSNFDNRNIQVLEELEFVFNMTHIFKFYPCFPAYPSSLLSLKSIFSIYYECVLGNNLVHHYHPIRLQS